MNKTLLVTGSAGRLGRRVVELLLDSGLARDRVIAGTRTPDRLLDLQERGAIVRHIDFDRPERLPEAFTGADRILIVSTDTLEPTGKRFEQHRSAVEAAVACGVERIFYTSVSHADSDSPEETPIAMCLDHAGTEQLLRDCGVPYTALRNTFYAEVLLPRLQQALATGHVSGIDGDSGISWLPRDDCARVAAAALLSDDPPDGAVEITGSEIITPRRVADMLTALTGRHIPFVARPAAALIDGLVASGLPRHRAAVLVSVEAALSTGYYDLLTDAVERLTGQSPTPLRDYVAMALQRGAIAA